MIKRTSSPVCWFTIGLFVLFLLIGCGTDVRGDSGPLGQVSIYPSGGGSDGSTGQAFSTWGYTDSSTWAPYASGTAVALTFNGSAYVGGAWYFHAADNRSAFRTFTLTDVSDSTGGWFRVDVGMGDGATVTRWLPKSPAVASGSGGTTNQIQQMQCYDLAAKNISLVPFTIGKFVNSWVLYGDMSSGEMGSPATQSAPAPGPTTSPTSQPFVDWVTGRADANSSSYFPYVSAWWQQLDDASADVATVSWVPTSWVDSSGVPDTTLPGPGNYAGFGSAHSWTLTVVGAFTQHFARIRAFFVASGIRAILGTLFVVWGLYKAISMVVVFVRDVAK